jgi:hypothetical protein
MSLDSDEDAIKKLRCPHRLYEYVRSPQESELLSPRLVQMILVARQYSSRLVVNRVDITDDEMDLLDNAGFKVAKGEKDDDQKIYIYWFD